MGYILKLRSSIPLDSHIGTKEHHSTAWHHCAFPENRAVSIPLPHRVSGNAKGEEGGKSNLKERKG